VDAHGAHTLGGFPVAGVHHRGGGGLVDGEEAGGGGRDVGDDERHVAALRLQAHRDAAEAKALGDLPV
jgi:hypothetical protein